MLRVCPSKVGRTDRVDAVSGYRVGGSLTPLGFGMTAGVTGEGPLAPSRRRSMECAPREAQFDSRAMAKTAASISTTQPQAVSASRRAPLAPSLVSARQDGSRAISPDSSAATTRWTSA
jgi:hypothetical protein